MIRETGPVGGSWSAARAGLEPLDVGAQGAISKTLRVFSRELGNLQRLQGTAARKGEVVTAAEIRLEFERQGGVLAARNGEAVLHSREPQATVVDRLEELEHAQPQAAPEPPPDDVSTQATKTGEPTSVAAQDGVGGQRPGLPAPSAYPDGRAAADDATVTGTRIDTQA